MKELHGMDRLIDHFDHNDIQNDINDTMREQKVFGERYR